MLKISEQSHNVFVNSELSANPHMEPGYTIYVNPYMTVNHDGRYTKHIFAGSDRVLSKIGNPKDYGADPTQLGLGLPNGKRGTLEGLIEKNCGELGIEDITYESQKPSSPGQDLGLTDENNDYEKLQYFFTKDHLGSSTIISDFEGKPVQHIEYTAFGESFADWRTETYDTPYRFTGKEQDAETGLYYYGARYYDPRLGRFLSVDRYAEKYPSLNPYNYCANNPLNAIDMNGDSIRFANANIQAYVESFTSQTIVKSNGKIKNNKNYNIEFAKVVSELKSDDRMFTFTDDASLIGGNELGDLSSDGNGHNFNIVVPNYTSGDKGNELELYGGRGGLLAEETYHGVQLVRGDVIAQGTGFTSGKSSLTGLEIDAKIFAAGTGMGFNYTSSYITDYRVPTQLGLISGANGDRSKVLDIITTPQTRTVYNNFNGNSKLITYPASYGLKR